MSPWPVCKKFLLCFLQWPSPRHSATIILHLGPLKACRTPETCGLSRNERQSGLSFGHPQQSRVAHLQPSKPLIRHRPIRLHLISPIEQLREQTWSQTNTSLTRAHGASLLACTLSLAVFHAGTGSWSPDLTRTRCACVHGRG